MMYLLTGHRIYRVVGHSTYREYAFIPSALYLRQPVSKYKSASYTFFSGQCPVSGYNPLIPNYARLSHLGQTRQLHNLGVIALSHI